jgi:tetratricopeptide (TPR) repeat protein
MNRRCLPVACKVAVAALVLLSIQRVHAQEADTAIFHRYRAVEPTIEIATKAVEAHHFDEAKKLLEPVLKLVPNHAEGHFLLARMAYEGRDFAVALDHIETSEGSLKNLDQCYAKILADTKAKDEVEARDVQTSVEVLKGTGTDSSGDIFATKQHHLDYLKTKELFSREVSFVVPSDCSFLHGNCLYRVGRASEAATQYQLAIRSNPVHAKAWNNLINLYWEAKDFAEARTALAKAEAAGVVIQPKLKQSVLEAN